MMSHAEEDGYDSADFDMLTGMRQGYKKLALRHDMILQEHEKRQRGLERNVEEALGELAATKKSFRFLYFMVGVFCVSIFFLSLIVCKQRANEIRRDAEVGQYGGDGGCKADYSCYNFPHGGK